MEPTTLIESARDLLAANITKPPCFLSDFLIMAHTRAKKLVNHQILIGIITKYIFTIKTIRKQSSNGTEI